MSGKKEKREQEEGSAGEERGGHAGEEEDEGTEAKLRAGEGKRKVEGDAVVPKKRKWRKKE